MKKLLLVVLTIGVVTTLYAQKRILRNMGAPTTYMYDEPAPQSASNIMTYEKPVKRTEIINGRSVTYVPLGQSGNVYSIIGNSRTYLWADVNLNSIVFTHRMIGNEAEMGRIAYDVSIDGGSTFATDVYVYNPTPNPQQWDYFLGRYPQGGILNPEGNTNPDNAYYTYFCPTLDMTNGNWGGYGYGSNILTDTSPPNPSQVNLTSDDDYWRYIPNAFTITQSGAAWYFDGSYEGADFTYTGDLIVGKGEITDGEIVYQESLMEFMYSGISINDTKIAFSPDGQTGYMLVMTDAGDIPFTNYHPVLLKTIDGGDTWSDPIHVNLGGTNGIESVKYYWSDEAIDTIDFYGSGFNRDEVYYNMGYHADIIVDAYGNPHLTSIIGVATDEGWYPYEGLMATWHMFSEDGGNTWGATALYDNKFLEGEIGGEYPIKQYNRPYISSDKFGEALFFSWIDTDLDGAIGNTDPNIFVCSYCIYDNYYSDVDNVTALSLYWFSAYYASMSQYVFSGDQKSTGPYEIPFVFTEFTVPGDPLSPVNYWYVDDYTVGGYPCYFSCEPSIGYDETYDLPNFSVSQNSPNPAKKTTSILVDSEESGIINLKVSNILGQVVRHQSVNNSALAHTFNIDVSNLDSGIYFYTVEIGNSSITKKMVVR